MTNKFWPRNFTHCHMGNLHMPITTREFGDIPGCTLLPPNERYAGKFPTIETVTFVNSLKERMKFFDDGERLQYGKPPRYVTPEPSKVEHPISYAPRGFVLEDEKWVFHRELI